MARKKEKVRRDHWEHGTTTGYGKQKCRCDPCAKAGRDYHRQYDEAHREERRRKNKLWREAHPDYEKDRYQNNPDRRASVAAKNKQRKARIRGADLHGCCTVDGLRLVLDFYSSKCVYCGAPHDHFDHLLAITKGGTHCISNLRTSCAACNGSKWNRDVEEWLASRRIEPVMDIYSHVECEASRGA